MNDWTNFIGYIIAPITSVIAWLVGRRKSKNDFLHEMQASIDLLVEKNKILVEEITALRIENSALRYDVQRLAGENKKMSKEIEELNTRLENVKTITKKVVS